MSYPPYNAGYNTPYPPQGGPPSFTDYRSTSPYPPQAPPTGAPPAQGYQGYPQNQPPYGGYQQPGGYTPQYAPTYNPGYGVPPPPQGQYLGGGYPSQYPAQPPHPGYGVSTHGAAAAPQQHATTNQPIRFRFYQKEGFDRSGKIVDAQGKVVYKLKDEADKHTFNFKSRPLMISRADGHKVACYDWKDSPAEAKIEAFAVWGAGSKKKLKVEGGVLDQDWKFRLPNGRAYEWDGPRDGYFDLLDHQQVTGDGFDAKPKSVARYSMHTEQRDATLDILPEALAVPDLLDAAVITSFHLEWSLSYTVQ